MHTYLQKLIKHNHGPRLVLQQESIHHDTLNDVHALQQVSPVLGPLHHACTDIGTRHGIDVENNGIHQSLIIKPRSMHNHRDNRPLTLCAVLCAINTTSGLVTSSGTNDAVFPFLSFFLSFLRTPPLPTGLITYTLTTSTRPPTIFPFFPGSPAHPRPKMRLQTTSPFAVSIAYTFPNSVAAMMSCRNPNGSRVRLVELAMAAGETVDGYDPVANRRTKLKR